MSPSVHAHLRSVDTPQVTHGTGPEAERLVGWMPEPSGRGTTTLLISCLLTMGLCVWTAIHTNPIPRPTNFRSLCLKLRLLILAVLAPEVILTAALDDFRQSKLLQKEMHRYRFDFAAMEDPDLKTADASGREFHSGAKMRTRYDLAGRKIQYEKLPLKMAFFAVMGGFAIKPPSDMPAMPLRLTPEGFLAMYRYGFIQDDVLNLKDIDDKAKADGLAKLIVCFQAFWLGLQCLGRLINRLPITLLEIHTICHVFCAIMMYLLWWEKPYGVVLPICVDLNDDALTRHIYACYIEKERKKVSAMIGGEVAGSYAYAQLVRTRSNGSLTADTYDFNKYSTRFKRYWRGIRVGGFTYIFNWSRTFWGWDHVNMPEVPVDTLDHFTGYEFSLNHVALRIKSIRKAAGDLENDSPQTTSAFLISLTLFGVIHLIAFRSHFPTQIEKDLWLVASIVTTANAFLFLAVPKITEYIIKKYAARWRKSVNFFNTTFVLLGLLISFGSRTFLVIESFISLRSLPVGAYETVAWAEYLPHL